MNHKIYYFLLASLLFVQCQPSDGIRLKKGMTISKSLTISEQVFNINGSDSINESVLIIEGNDIVIDFNGATLQGSNDKSEPNEFHGLGILVKNGSNITIKNLNIRGYKMALKVVEVDKFKLENCDFSYNYRQKIISDSEKDLFRLNFNKKDNWKKFGAGVHLKKCDKPFIKNLTITEGQNGVVLENCNNGLLYNNIIQFNSGSAISLFQSNNNRIMHNKLDWNVRGDLMLERTIGSDAGGVLVSENSSNNMIAYNSATHCNTAISIKSSRESYNDGTGNSDNNIIYGNDCSYAVHSSIKTMYSQSKIFNNIINKSNYAINCTFSNHSMIMGNAINDNETGIYLSNVQYLQIRENELFRNKVGLFTDLVKHIDYHPDSNNVFSMLNYNISIDHNLFNQNSLEFNINHSKLVKIVLNQFENSYYISQKGNNNENLILKSNEKFPEIIKEINNSAFLTYAPAGFRDGINTRLTNIQRGKEYILMNEYGVYSFRYPKLFLRDKIEETGQYSFAFFGPKGNFKFKKGINVKEINLENGTLPSNIVITKEDISKPISLQIEFVGIAIETQFGNKYKEGETFLVEWKD